LRARYWVPGTVTAANIGCGLAAIFLAAEDRYNLAVYMLVVAILLDMLDGRLARLLKATSDFGKQFDSLSDALSFGAAPAILIQRAVLQPLGSLGYVAAGVYLLAVVLRLARFNLAADPHAKAKWTTGMPCPIGASYLMAATLMRGHYEPIWAVTLMLVMTVLLVSRIKLPDLKGKNFVSAMLLIGMCNYFAVIFHPSWRTILWWNVWNGLILIAARIGERRVGREALEG
jgi:CDP-diacylglycerol--serine O-phosphatidyltransferase